MSRRFELTAVLSTLVLLTGCASAGRRIDTAPAVPLTVQRVVSSASGKTIPFAEMADAVSKADMVFFGEQHDDDESHRAELALLQAIGQRRGKVILSLEMFERDVQQVLDAYLAGRLSEEEFKAQSRPWPNYAADYRPLVELAKANRWPVLASNIPRRLASRVSRGGLGAVDSLPPGDRALVAAQLQCPKDQYYTNFLAAMGGGHGGATPAATAANTRAPVDLFYEAQCVKDETMAESIVRLRERVGRDAIVVHYNGAFHSDFALGTAARVQRRLPDAKIAVVSAVPTPTPASADATEFLPRGQFIILAQRLKP